MPLFKDSRYSDINSRDEILVDQSGTRYRTLFRYPATTGTRTVKYYVWRRGDRIDRIAAQYLGSSSDYYKIMDLNPEILDASQIEPGTRVRLP